LIGLRFVSFSFQGTRLINIILRWGISFNPITHTQFTSSCKNQFSELTSCKHLLYTNTKHFLCQLFFI